MQDSCQKIKLLKLHEFLHRNTDAHHPVTTGAILEYLSTLGISCDRRTLAKDIAALNKYGYEIMDLRVGKEKGYYVEDRSFSVPELKILIDAVQAASFITPKKTEELISKLAVLSGGHRAELLQGNMFCLNHRKHGNEQVFYNVFFLEEALLKKKKITFRYFDLNEHAQKVYRKNGTAYEEEPVGLVYNEDNYYLLVYTAKYEDIITYRIDRMDSVSLLAEKVSDKAIKMRSDMPCFIQQSFKMFGGNPVNITLQFDHKLIGAVFDKFGERTKMIRINETTCVADVIVQISPTFWGWLFQFGNRMKILSPVTAITECKEKIEQLTESFDVVKK